MDRPKRRRPSGCTDIAAIQEVEGDAAARRQVKRPAVAQAGDRVPTLPGNRSSDVDRAFSNTRPLKQAVLSSMLLSQEKKSSRDAALARDHSASAIIQAGSTCPAQGRGGMSEVASTSALVDAHRPSAPSNLVDLSNIDDTDTSSHAISILDSVGSSSAASILTHGSASTMSGSAASVRTMSLGASTPARKLVFSDVDYGCPIMTEYVDEIYQHYLSEEAARAPNNAYMRSQVQINERMRAILVDWLVEVVNKYRQQPETLHLAVSIMDRYLMKRMVARTRLQLVGVTALLIASKFEQTFRYEVRVEDMTYICDGAYTAPEVRECEAAVLKALDFRISIPTLYTFLVRLLKVADADQKTTHFAQYLCERSLQEYDVLGFKPSHVAAACVNVVLRSMRGPDAWSLELEAVSTLSQEALSPCIRILEGILSGTSTCQANLHAVSKRYLAPKLSSVSLECIATLHGEIMTPPPIPGVPPAAPASGQASAPASSVATTSSERAV